MGSFLSPANLIRPSRPRALASHEPVWVRWLLTCTALGFVVLFLVVPLVVVFTHAFRDGLQVYWDSISNEEARSALELTLLVAAITVPLNTLFGIMAAWCISKFEFRGKRLLVILIDLPVSVSPVVAGLVYVLLFGNNGLLGAWLDSVHVQIIYAVPGIVIATTFVTFPFVARELLPVMQASGNEEEEAAIMLGADGLTVFRRITLPKVKWGLIYGVILCNARAFGEFGAVSVVSGHIQGVTDTLPLYVEVMYNSRQTHAITAAFAAATVLAILALITLAIKSFIEWRMHSAEKLRHATEGIPHVGGT